jgi:hypothetical protein
MQLCSIDETEFQLKGNLMVRMETPETELCKCRGITPKKCFGSVHEAHIACTAISKAPGSAAHLKVPTEELAILME